MSLCRKKSLPNCLHQLKKSKTRKSKNQKKNVIRVFLIFLQRLIRGNRARAFRQSIPLFYPSIISRAKQKTDFGGKRGIFLVTRLTKKCPPPGMPLLK